MTTCPRCNSEDIDQTAKFDLTSIFPDECVHDFECFECGSLFTVTYRAIQQSLVEVEDE